MNEIIHEKDALIRVMTVDDSAVVRGLISRALQQHPDILVVASASDGAMALKVLPHHQVDVIILDIEMPNMDGMEALPELLACSPHTHIIMASTLTQRNAHISLKALELGASDYLAKPNTQEGADAIERFYRELTEKVIQLGRAAKGLDPHVADGDSLPVHEPERVMDTSQSSPAAIPVSSFPVPSKTTTVRCLAIAASTGGPPALIQLLKASKDALTHIPICITQHMPPTFTTLLAEHIASDTGIDCKEGEEGEQLQPGKAYVAPGDYHMRFEAREDGVYIKLNQDAPINYCRPAADPMLESLAGIYGQGLLTLILTGMGNDGTMGAAEVRKHGGEVIAQDKQSSVVWGMPGSVVKAHLSTEILALSEMPDYMRQRIGGL